ASGIEPAGEDSTLTRGGADEIWRGSIRTAFGSAVTDGILQVREGDTITASYQDLSPAHTASATAQILASGPTIHDVAVVDTSAKRPISPPSEATGGRHRCGTSRISVLQTSRSSRAAAP